MVTLAFCVGEGVAKPDGEDSHTDPMGMVIRDGIISNNDLETHIVSVNMSHIKTR